jgi:hypothetical protein
MGDAGRKGWIEFYKTKNSWNNEHCDLKFFCMIKIREALPKPAYYSVCTNAAIFSKF